MPASCEAVRRLTTATPPPVGQIQVMDLPPFKPYANRSGQSGVRAYALLPGSILLRFADDRYIYLYDDVEPGAADVEAMHERAEAGSGLATYVNQHVRNRYHARFDPPGW